MVKTKKKTKQKTDWMPKSEEERVTLWKTRKDASVRYMRERFIKNADRWRDFYKGLHWESQRHGVKEQGDRIVVNYTYAIIKAIMPQIYYQDPYLYVSAAREKYQDGEQLTEDVLNNAWRTIKTKKNMRAIDLDALIMSFGVGKLGYYTDIIRDKSKANLETGLDYTEYVKSEYPYFIRVSTRDVIFDIDVNSFDAMRWMGSRYWIPVNELKERFNYSGDIKGTHISDKDFVNSYYEFNDNKGLEEEFKKVEVWEIQDLVTGKFYTFCEGYDKFLDEKKDVYDFGNFNYKILAFNPCPDELLPISDISQIEDLNLELDKTRTQQMQHRAKGVRKILTEEDAFMNKAERAKFLSGKDMEMVILASGAIKENKILIVDASSQSAELYNINEINKDDLNNISAVGNQQRGAESQVAKTAYESAVIDRNANLRNSERLTCINEYSEEVGRDLLKILQKFPTKEDEFFVEKRKEWIKWAKENIAGEFNVKITAGSTMRRNDELERDMMLQLVPQMVNQQTPEGKMLVDPKEVFAFIMKKYGITQEEIDKMIPEISPEPPPPEPEPPAMGASGAEPTPEELAEVLVSLGALPPQGGGMPQGGMGGGLF